MNDRNYILVRPNPIAILGEVYRSGDFVPDEHFDYLNVRGQGRKVAPVELVIKQIEGGKIAPLDALVDRFGLPDSDDPKATLLAYLRGEEAPAPVEADEADEGEAETIEDRRAAAVSLRDEGKTLNEIAEALGVSVSTVRRDLEEAD